MGSLVSGIFDLMSGDPTKQQENQLNDLSSYETGTGKGATTAANDYYSGILSGDPAEIAKTLAPEIKAGQEQVSQQAKTNAEFGNRSGGVNASTNAAQAGERGNIINLIGGLQQGAAGAEAGLGTNLLSQSSGNINSSAGLASANQNRMSSDVGGIANGAAQVASDIFAPGASSLPGIGSTSAQVTPGADFGPGATNYLPPMQSSVPDLSSWETSPEVTEAF